MGQSRLVFSIVCIEYLVPDAATSYYSTVLRSKREEFSAGCE